MSVDVRTEGDVVHVIALHQVPERPSRSAESDIAAREPTSGGTAATDASGSR